MNRTIPFLLFMVLSIEAFTQIRVYRQRYFVTNQPQEAAISQNNFIGLGKSTLTINGSNSKFWHNMHIFQGFFVAVANKPKILISLGGGYQQELFHSGFPLQGKTEGAWAMLFGTADVGDDYFWRAFSLYGSFSGEEITFNSETHQFIQLTQFGKKWRPELSTSLGALILTNFGDLDVIPIAHVIYSRQSWVFDFIIPIDVSVRYRAKDGLHFILQHKTNNRPYHHQSLDLTFNYDFNEFILKSEIQLYRVLWLDLGVSRTYTEKLKWQDGKDYQQIGKLEDSFFLNASLFIRFPAIDTKEAAD